MKIRMPRRLTSLLLAGVLTTGLACSKPKNEEKPNNNEDKNISVIEDEIVLQENENNIELQPIYAESEVIEETNTKEETIEEKIMDNLELSYYVTAIDNVNIRANANKKSDKLGMLFKGQSLKLIGDLDGWAKVEYDGSVAYISKDYLEFVESYEFPTNEDIPVIDSDKGIDYYLDGISSIEATAVVNVRKEPNTNCDKLDQLSKGDKLPLIREFNDEWYEVEYNGVTAYVYKEYAKVSNNYTTKYEFSDIVFMISRTPLYNIDNFEVIKEVPKNEVAEVYAQTDDYYLVKVNGTIGYISKEHSQSLGDNYVIIDISSQNLKVYVDDKAIIDTPIVTGKDSTPTYCGVFDVYKKEENVHWPEFNVTVRYGLAFNRGEWMHDASWRKSFGGDQYHRNGSHGCVNIHPDVMKDVFENVEIGTPVLVKK